MLDDLERSGQWSVSLDELEELPDTLGALPSKEDMTPMGGMRRVDLLSHPLPTAVKNYLTPRSCLPLIHSIDAPPSFQPWLHHAICELPAPSMPLWGYLWAMPPGLSHCGWKTRRSSSRRPTRR